MGAGLASRKLYDGGL